MHKVCPLPLQADEKCRPSDYRRATARPFKPSQKENHLLRPIRRIQPTSHSPYSLKCLRSHLQADLRSGCSTKKSVSCKGNPDRPVIRDGKRRIISENNEHPRGASGVTQHTEARILCADDTDAQRYAVSRVLGKAGFEAIEAKTGHEALALMPNQPHLVVLDVNLPDISGLEVCRIIKASEQTKRTPILQVSATLVSAGARVAGLEGGGDAYLVQPIEPEELIATVINASFPRADHSGYFPTLLWRFSRMCNRPKRDEKKLFVGTFHLSARSNYAWLYLEFRSRLLSQLWGSYLECQLASSPLVAYSWISLQRWRGFTVRRR